MIKVIKNILPELLGFSFGSIGVYYISRVLELNPYQLWLGFIPIFILIVVLLKNRGRAKAKLPINEIIYSGNKQLFILLVLTILPVIFLWFSYISLMSDAEAIDAIALMLLFFIITPLIALFALIGLLRSLFLFKKTKYQWFFMYIVLFTVFAGGSLLAFLGLL